MNTLTILTWPDYVNPKTIEQFETGFDVKVNLDIVPSAVELIERMKGNGPMPDVLVPPDYAVRELGAEDRLAVLDHAKLSNFEHLEKRFQAGRAHDASSRISLVKDWGTTGFILRTDMVHEAPASWRDFWVLAGTYSGRVTVLDSPGEVIGAALKMRGPSYNASGVEELSLAREDLL
ncbi:MAG TPA: extracellular solute-binding protein, partial [Anaerolineales bacterium]|nr:extracellular solute-binding protein [Anaerolineales bacterium]